MGSPMIPFGALSIAALRGQQGEFAELARTMGRDAEDRGEGQTLAVIEFAAGVLNNGLGEYEAALAAVADAERFPEEGPVTWALTELIEAAVRCGRPERGEPALKLVMETTQAAGTDWGLGIEARCRALLSEGETAEASYLEAIERLEGTRIRVQHARAHLLYGEWLRRQRRRLDARQQLRTAYEMFVEMGIDAFAERAGRELLATGEQARKRSVEAGTDLTAQEAQIARLARDGLANAEIGERLFISRHTVEYHLRKVFAKLGIDSRGKLANALPPDAHHH
jgi:DNA-binding CsgD family transcriptional regulator